MLAPTNKAEAIPEIVPKIHMTKKRTCNCSAKADDGFGALPRGPAECACSATNELDEALFGPDRLQWETLAFVVEEGSRPAVIPWTQ